MAGTTNMKSPLHEQMCVAGSTILGGAVGSAVPVAGTLAGAAAGFIIGVLICSRDVISKPMGGQMDIERAWSEFETSAQLQEKMATKLVEAKIAPDQKTATTLVGMVVRMVAADKAHYLRTANTNQHGGPTGRAAHGLHDLVRHAATVSAPA